MDGGFFLQLLDLRWLNRSGILRVIVPIFGADNRHIVVLIILGFILGLGLVRVLGSGNGWFRCGGNEHLNLRGSGEGDLFVPGGARNDKVRIIGTGRGKDGDRSGRRGCKSLLVGVSTIAGDVASTGGGVDALDRGVLF